MLVYTISHLNKIPDKKRIVDYLQRHHERPARNKPDQLALVGDRHGADILPYHRVDHVSHVGVPVDRDERRAHDIFHEQVPDPVVLMVFVDTIISV